jgi:hypothetical protein
MQQVCDKSGGGCVTVGTCRCIPTTCAQLGVSSGIYPDGCGSTIDCGGQCHITGAACASNADCCTGICYLSGSCG